MTDKQKMHAVTYVRREALKHILEHGLLSGNEMAKPENIELLRAARPGDGDDGAAAWLKSREEKIKDQFWTKAYAGPNLMFGDADPDKIHDKHVTRRLDMVPLKVDLSKFLEDHPDTVTHGVELSKYDEAAYDKAEKEGEAAVGAFIHNRHHDLTRDELKALFQRGKDPKDMWQHYNDPEGRLYAGDVPHMQVLTPKIDPKYFITDGNLEKEAKASKGCVMAFIESDQKKPFLAFGKTIPESELYREEKHDSYGEDGYGLEKEPHVTVLYGLTGEGDKFKATQKIVQGFGPATFTLGKLSIFDNKDYDVLKVDVKSDDLVALNKMLKELPYSDSYPGYHPHLTIAYLKKGEGAKYVGKDVFAGEEFSVDDLMHSTADKKRQSITLLGDKADYVKKASTSAKPTDPTAHHRYLSDDDEHEKYAPVGIDGLLAATEKLLAVNRGLAEPDERDSLPNDRIYTVDRLMAERIKLDHGRVLRNTMGRLSRMRNLSPLSADAFGDYTVGYIKSNPLVPALEEINPMHILEQKRRITKMGPGGIGDPNAVTETMQNVSATQFGFIDPIAGPESSSAGIDVRLAHGTRIGSDGRIYQLLLNRRTGKKQWVSPSDLRGKTLKLPE